MDVKEMGYEIVDWIDLAHYGTSGELMNLPVG
jgi:hypothetical protein